MVRSSECGAHGNGKVTRQQVDSRLWQRRLTGPSCSGAAQGPGGQAIGIAHCPLFAVLRVPCGVVKYVYVHVEGEPTCDGKCARVHRHRPVIDTVKYTAAELIDSMSLTVSV